MFSVVAKFSNAEIQREFSLCNWYRRSFNCCSAKFQVKVGFHLYNGRQKGQAHSIYIYGIVLRRRGWPVVERWNHWHARIQVRGEKLCQTKHVINVTLFIACWQNCKDITAWETQFQRFDLLRFQSFPLSESEASKVSRMLLTYKPIIFLGCESMA